SAATLPTLTSGLAISRRMSSAPVTRSMARTRGLTASYRPLVLMSFSMPDKRRVSLAPVNTLAPSGISSLTRTRAAATSSRISTVKPWALSAAAARSRLGAGAGSTYIPAVVAVVMVPPGGNRWRNYSSGCGPGERGGVEVSDLVDALGELPAVAGAPVAVVVDGVVKALVSVAGSHEFLEIGAAGGGIAVQLDRARVRCLHEDLPLLLQSLAPGADLLSSDQLNGDVGHPQRAVLGEQRRQTGAVAHHRGIGELTAQRLDLDPVGDDLKVTHRSVFLLAGCCVRLSSTTGRPGRM